MAVRVDRPGTLSFDYQTAGGGTFNGGRYGVRKADGGFGGTVVSRRSYLADASFLAALGGEDHDLVVEIDRALRNPHWPLFLGRRAFVPSTSVAAGIFDGAPESALSTVQALARGQKRVRMMVEVEADGLPRNDQPVSFVSDSRTYSTRLVADREIELP
jgi:CRISPR system Cascade subunit CasD